VRELLPLKASSALLCLLAASRGGSPSSGSGQGQTAGGSSVIDTVESRVTRVAE
jgi:hypothetical protein